MLSTRKQRAKERRSRQEDLMSHTENLDVMSGSYSKNELESNSIDRNDEMDLGPIGLDKTLLKIVKILCHF